LTNDSGTAVPALTRNNKDRVFAIGPEFGVILPTKHLNFLARVLPEFGVQPHAGYGGLCHRKEFSSSTLEKSTRQQSDCMFRRLKMINHYETYSKTLVLAVALGVCLISLVCKAERSVHTAPAERPAQTETPKEEPAPANASEGLQRLMAGNQRFVAGSPQHGHESIARRKELAAEQHPFATVLGCSDSRVPVELLFDQGLGDLFVVRVAGNVADVDDLGSIEYAVEHLHTPLVLVLGHESCGAVTAALEPEAARKKEAKDIQELLAHILPALKGIDPTLNQNERVHRGVESNVRWSMQQLQNTPELKEKITGGQLKIVGGVYELDTGKVRLL